MRKKEKEQEELRKVPIKNYVILTIAFLVTFLIILYLCNWYQVYDEYQRKTPVINGTLSELTSIEELEHYIMENQTTVIYMCTASDDNCRNFEKEFKKLIEKKELQDSIIYLNLSNINQDEFVNSFNSNYQYKVKLTSNYPAIVIFEDNKVTNILQGTKKQKLTIEKTKQFIEINKIGE